MGNMERSEEVRGDPERNKEMRDGRCRYSRWERYKEIYGKFMKIYGRYSGMRDGRPRRDTGKYMECSKKPGMERKYREIRDGKSMAATRRGIH
jgi:hypothetical protein